MVPSRARVAMKAAKARRATKARKATKGEEGKEGEKGKEGGGGREGKAPSWCKRAGPHGGAKKKRTPLQHAPTGSARSGARRGVPARGAGAP